MALFSGLLRGRGWRRFAPVLIPGLIVVAALSLGLAAVHHYESKISQRAMAAHMNQTAPQADVYVVNKLSDVSSLRFYLERMSLSSITTMPISSQAWNFRKARMCRDHEQATAITESPNPIFLAVNPDHEDFKRFTKTGYAYLAAARSWWFTAIKIA